MWITLPPRIHRGVHHVDVPENFTKSRDDFDSEASYLKALRECHMQNDRAKKSRS